MQDSQALTSNLVRAVAIAAGLLMVTILTVQRSEAVFTATTDNTGSAFSTGTVVLTDDDGGTALFSATGMTPGTPEQSCIVVTYSGSELPAPVRLSATTTGSLDTYLNTTIDVGTGGTFAGCTGFTPTSTIFSGTLENLATTHPAWATGLPVFTASATPTSATLRITVEVIDDPAAQGSSATADLNFETRA